MQSGGGLSFPRRLSKSSRALPRIAQELGRSDRSAARGLRNRGCKLRRLAPFVGQSPQSAAAGSAGAQTAARINSGLDRTLSFRLARAKWPRNLTGRIFRAHVAELADAYGSGPYGATRGGSRPLVSIAEVDRAVPCSMLIRRRSRNCLPSPAERPIHLSARRSALHFAAGASTRRDSCS